MKLFCNKSGQIIYPLPESMEDFEALKDGDCIVEVKKPRNIKFFRKWWALINYAYKNWETDYCDATQKSIESFRKEITILAGYYKQVWKINGDFMLEAESISFANMTETEFSALYSKTIDVILRNVLKNYTKNDLDNIINNILRFS